MARAWRVVISIAFFFAMSGISVCELRAQTIHVDAAAGHVTNTIPRGEGRFDGAKANASSGIGLANGFVGTVDVVTFGAAQYQWHPGPSGGHAGPDGPAARSTVNANAATKFILPAALVTALRGRTAK